MINHLEVSTLTALVCVLAALALRRQSAALRHAILLIGVLRFAAYTPWLAAAGSKLARFVPAHAVAAPPVANITVKLLRFDQGMPLLPPAPAPLRSRTLRDAAWLLWYAGATFGVGLWLGRLARPAHSIREATFWERDVLLQAAASLGMKQKVELRIVPSDHAPGAQGWVRPRVLLPDGLVNQLSDPELQAVLTHELAHLRRRDPLTGGLVRGVVAVFWFNPLLWWMERRLLAERETACDEMVLAYGARREDYVAGIAKVCRGIFYRGAAYAEITGANLTRRIEHIMSAELRSSEPRRQWSNRWSALLRAIPMTLGLAAALLPMAGGLLRAETSSNAGGGLFQIAELTRRNGNLNAALELFRKAEEAGNRAAGLQVALILDGAGHRLEAIHEYEKVLKTDPDNSTALNNAAYMLAEDGRNLDQALVYALRAKQLLSDSAPVSDTLGRVYFKRNMPDQAILAFRDPVMKEPNNWAYRSHLAMALDEKPKPQDWMQELKAALRSDPTNTNEARMRELLRMIGR